MDGSKVDEVAVRERVQRTVATLGGVLWLCRHSPLHQRYPVSLLLERISVSIDLEQYRYYENDRGVPVAFCNWAFLSDGLLEQASAGKLRFQPAHWQSGDNLFFLEMIAPFGHCRKVIRDLRTNIFPKGTPAFAVRGNADPSDAEARRPPCRFRNV